MMLRTGRLRGWTPISSSGAATLLGSEAQGLAIDFTDASMVIRDTGTPANDYSSTPYGKLTYTSPSLKMCRQSSGLYAYGAHNLILQSETYSSATWTKSNVTVASGGTHPSGNSSFVLTDSVDGGSVSHQLIQSITTTTGSSTSVSFDVKLHESYTKNWVAIIIIDNAGSYATYFNLADGTKGTDNSNGSGSIESLGGGWYRITRTQTPVISGASFGCRLYTANSDGVTNYQGAGVNQLYISRCTVSLNPSNSTYLSTTTAARYELPYEWDASGNALGCLVEEQRTNICLYSDDLTNGSWAKQSITAAKTATGPDGVANSATTLTASHANNGIGITTSKSSVQGVSSLWVKRRTGTGNVYLARNASATGSDETTADGTFATSTGWTVGAGWSITGGKAVATAAGSSGLYCIPTGSLTTSRGRVIQVTFTVSNYASGALILRGASGSSVTTASANGTYVFRLFLQDGYLYFNGSATFTGDIDNVSMRFVDYDTLTITSSWTRIEQVAETSQNPQFSMYFQTNGDAIDVWGCQHEAGAFATSYIPTTSATVTRAADNINIATTLFPSMATAATIFADWTPRITSSNFPLTLAATTANYLVIRAAANAQAEAYNTSVQQAFISGSAIVVGTVMKAAFAAAANSMRFASSGVLQGVEDTSCSMPASLTQINIGSSVSGATSSNAHIKRVLALPRRMTNGELQTVTT
jgi:hypothetical protein